EPVLKISDRNQKLFWKKWLNYARETGDVANLQSLWFQKKKEEGENLLAQNQLNEAEIVFKAILQREPVEINALYYLGFINYMKGLNELAEQFFLKVLEINPEAKQARTYLDTIRQNISN
ncbi:MAG: hypothetical protein HYV28_03225, partial [Ignavibacteriales bacterium]|nr:hypothetical protein [Ignavibacteriales bacterium]